MALLVTEGLSKELGGRFVLSGVSVTVEPGHCLALFGANGSGKSTFLRLLATLWRPTHGRLLWNGRDVNEARSNYRRILGYVGHEPLVYGDWSARENLAFFGRLHGIDDVGPRVDGLLADVGLTGFADEPVTVYSRGMVQRLALARAFLHDPDVLLLDEPFTGLDAASRALTVERLQAASERGKTLVLVTHDVGIGYELGTEVAFLRRGRFERIDAPSLNALRADVDALLGA